MTTAPNGGPVPIPAAAYALDGDRSVGIDFEATRLADQWIDAGGFDACVALGGCASEPYRCNPSCVIATPPSPTPSPPESPRLPATLPPPCALGALARLDAGECAPLGRVCPAGAFAADLPFDAVFVDPRAAPGGDGSEGRPYTSLAMALGLAAIDGTIALAGAELVERVTIDASVHLEGACAERTRISGSITVEGLGVSLGSLTIQGADALLTVRGEVDLRGVALEGGGVDLQGRLTGRALHIGSPTIAGIYASGGSVDLEDWEIENGTNRGFVARDGTVARLRNGVLRGTTANAAGLGDQFTGGILIESSSVTVDRAFIVGATHHALSFGARSFGVVRDVAIDRVDPWLAGPEPETEEAFGLFVADATVALSRLAIHDARAGIWATRAAVTGVDLGIDDVGAREGRPANRDVGMRFELGSTFGGARIAITDVAGNAIRTGAKDQAFADPSRFVAADLLVARTTSPAHGILEGQGLFAWAVSEISIERAIIRETDGVGAWAREGATLELSDVAIEGAAGAGIYATDHSHVEARGLTIVASTPTSKPIDGTWYGRYPIEGPGLAALDAPTVRVRGAVVRDHRGPGARAYAPTIFELDEVRFDRNGVGVGIAGLEPFRQLLRVAFSDNEVAVETVEP